MYPGKVLEDIGSCMIVLGILGILGTLFAALEIAALTSVFFIFVSITVFLCLVGYILLSIGYKKHIKWCRDMGYIK